MGSLVRFGNGTGAKIILYENYTLKDFYEIFKIIIDLLIKYIKFCIVVKLYI